MVRAIFKNEKKLVSIIDCRFNRVCVNITALMSLASLFTDNKMIGGVAFATFNLLFLARLRTLTGLSMSTASNFNSKPRTTGVDQLKPIKTKKIPSKITFGVNGDEYRGENPMDPPRVRVSIFKFLTLLRTIIHS